MKDLVKAWLDIPGRTQWMSAKQIARKIEEKWPRGEPLDEAYFQDVEDALEELAEEGTVATATPTLYW